MSLCPSAQTADAIYDLAERLAEDFSDAAPTRGPEPASSKTTTAARPQVHNSRCRAAQLEESGLAGQLERLDSLDAGGVPQRLAQVGVLLQALTGPQQSSLGTARNGQAASDDRYGSAVGWPTSRAS
jgi:hypothetical protein